MMTMKTTTIYLILGVLRLVALFFSSEIMLLNPIHFYDNNACLLVRSFHLSFFFLLHFEACIELSRDLFYSTHAHLVACSCTQRRDPTITGHCDTAYRILPIEIQTTAPKSVHQKRKRIKLWIQLWLFTKG